MRLIIVVSCIAAAAAAVAAVPASAVAPRPIAFGTPVAVPTPLSAAPGIELLRADVDGDGDADLVAGQSSSGGPNGFVVLTNSGGVFTPGPFVTSGLPTAAGDVDGDGRADLLVANDDTHFQLQFSRPGGVFEGGPVSIGGVFDTDLLADVNGDGHLDIVESKLESIVTHAGDGHGGFAAPVTQKIARRESKDRRFFGDDTGVAIGDVTGDGKADVVIPSYEWVRRSRHRASVHSAVAVLPGLGDGRFGKAVVSQLGTGAVGMTDPVIADVNGDGRRDIVSGTVGDGRQVEAALAVLGKGKGRFAHARCSGLPSCRTYFNASGQYGYVNVAVGDFDGDARPDIAAAEFDLGDPRILRGDGHGGFRSQKLLMPRTGLNNIRVVAGDFDGHPGDDVALFNGRVVTVVPGERVNVPATTR